MIPDRKVAIGAFIPQIRRLMYDQFQMRRALSILLILLFGVGPLSATLEASEDSRLPACCRRQGAHHCAMPAESMSARNSAPAFRAPTRCPSFPNGSAAPLPPVYGLAAPAVSLPVLLAQPHSPASARASARLSQIRTRSGRAPPSLQAA